MWPGEQWISIRGPVCSHGVGDGTAHLVDRERLAVCGERGAQDHVLECFQLGNVGAIPFNVPLYQFLTHLTHRISSVSVGRLSQLPRAAADVQRPTLFERIETQKWEPYADANMESDVQLKESAHSMLFLNELSSLSELASDMVNSFYAPREPFTSRRLATFHARYQDWYQNLPEVLWLENTSLPHVLVLHMYYFACILQ